VRKRRQAEQRLNAQGEQLKDIVNERTAELSLTNKELLLEVDSRKKAEAAIRKSDEQWDRTFNSFTDIVTLQDTDCV